MGDDTWKLVLGRSATRNQRQTANQRLLAQEVLQMLLGSQRPIRSNGRQGTKEWTCVQCKCPNFLSRTFCRHCSASCPAQRNPQRPQQQARVPVTEEPKEPAVRLAPWAKVRAAAQDATTLEAALTAAKVAGGSASDAVIIELEQKLLVARKASTDTRPLTEKLAGCREAIARREKKLCAADEALQQAQRTRDDVAADLEEHRQHLKQLEMESARHTAPDHESAAVPEALQQLRDELNALKTAHEVAKAELARQGAEQLEHFRREYASIAAERDSLRCELSAAKGQVAADVAIRDVPTLEAELVAKEADLAAARSAGDVDKYEQISAEHARLSSALARAMRMRVRA